MESVERTLALPTDVEDAWALLTRPEDLAAWLGDEVQLDPTPGARGRVVERGGTERTLVVERVEAGRCLSWRWWPASDGPGEATSRVEITLTPTDAGTLVRIVEAPIGVAPVASATGEAWSHRLLHLEAHLLLAAAIRG